MMLPSTRTYRVALANRLLGPAPGHRFVGTEVFPRSTEGSALYTLTCACGKLEGEDALCFEDAVARMVSRHRSDGGLLL